MWLMCIRAFDRLLNNFEGIFLWWMSLALYKIIMKFHLILSKFKISMNFQKILNSDCSIFCQGLKYRLNLIKPLPTKKAHLKIRIKICNLFEKLQL